MRVIHADTGPNTANMPTTRLDIPTACAAVADALRAAGTPERAENEKRYLKSPLEHFGATVPAIRREVKRFGREHPGLAGADLVAVVEALWASPVHEPRMFAVLLLEERAATLTPDHLPLLERMLRESFTWAYVDNLAATAVGPIIDRYPKAAAILDQWARDDNFWMRRSAMLALLLPLRRGDGDFDRFTRYADSMLGEKEFFIRKAIGWVLRDTSRKRPGMVRDYLAARLDRVSGLTLREGAKRLPDAERGALLAAHEPGRKRRSRA